MKKTSKWLNDEVVFTRSENLVSFHVKYLGDSTEHQRFRVYVSGKKGELTIGYADQFEEATNRVIDTAMQLKSTQDWSFLLSV